MELDLDGMADGLQVWLVCNDEVVFCINILVCTRFLQGSRMAGFFIRRDDGTDMRAEAALRW